MSKAGKTSFGRMIQLQKRRGRRKKLVKLPRQPRKLLNKLKKEKNIADKAIH